MIAAYVWNINHAGIVFNGMIETGVFTVATSVDEARRWITEVAPEYAELVKGEPDLVTPYGTVAKLRVNLEPKSLHITPGDKGR